MHDAVARQMNSGKIAVATVSLMRDRRVPRCRLMSDANCVSRSIGLGVIFIRRDVEIENSLTQNSMTKKTGDEDPRFFLLLFGLQEQIRRGGMAMQGRCVEKREM